MLTFDNVMGGEIASLPDNGQLLGCLIQQPTDDIPADIAARVKRSNATETSSTAVTKSSAGAAQPHVSSTGSLTNNAPNAPAGAAAPADAQPGSISLRRGAKFVFGGVEVLVKAVTLHSYASPFVCLSCTPSDEMC
jgi:hypothetical protein